MKTDHMHEEKLDALEQDMPQWQVAYGRISDGQEAGYLIVSAYSDMEAYWEASAMLGDSPTLMLGRPTMIGGGQA